VSDSRLVELAARYGVDPGYHDVWGAWPKVDSTVEAAVLALCPTKQACDQMNPATGHPYKEGTPGVTGYRSEVMAEVMVQEDKLTRLAEAIPADKYTWRPSDDTRSFAEVLLHISAANYNLYKLVGTPPPSGIDIKGLEKSTTDKAKVVATLKDSFAHAKQAIKAMPDADLEKSLDWFGGKNTERGILLFVVRHAAEHLGQSIAYARMAGVI